MDKSTQEHVSEYAATVSSNATLVNVDLQSQHGSDDSDSPMNTPPESVVGDEPQVDRGITMSPDTVRAESEPVSDGARTPTQNAGPSTQQDSGEPEAVLYHLKQFRYPTKAVSDKTGYTPEECAETIQGAIEGLGANRKGGVVKTFRSFESGLPITMIAPPGENGAADEKVQAEMEDFAKLLMGKIDMLNRGEIKTRRPLQLKAELTNEAAFLIRKDPNVDDDSVIVQPVEMQGASEPGPSGKNE